RQMRRFRREPSHSYPIRPPKLYSYRGVTQFVRRYAVPLTFDRRGKCVLVPPLVALSVLVVVLLSACAQPSPPLPPIEVVVNANLEPTRDDLPGFEDGEPRPLAAAVNEDGQVADFVANEV